MKNQPVKTCTYDRQFRPSEWIQLTDVRTLGKRRKKQMRLSNRNRFIYIDLGQIGKNYSRYAMKTYLSSLKIGNISTQRLKAHITTYFGQFFKYQFL